MDGPGIVARTTAAFSGDRRTTIIASSSSRPAPGIARKVIDREGPLITLPPAVVRTDDLLEAGA